MSAGTSSVDVSAIPNNADATVSVTGNTGLSAGANTVTIRVTAADLSTQNYTITVNVLTLSEVTTLSVLTVNGQDALASSTVNVGNEVTEAFVVAQTTSSAASYAVTSSTSLPEPGTYTITVLVTAENTNFTQSYNVTVIRAAGPSDNADLDTIKVNDQIVEVGSSFDVAYGTASVEVVATAVDAGATVLVTGNTGLKTGANEVTIFITAANSSVVSYKFNVQVAKSNNVELSSISINGNAVSLIDLLFDVDATTSSVVVSASAADVDASVTVTGQDNLKTGSNAVVITVTAADGTSTREYTVNVVRAALSSNVELRSITLNGVTVEAGQNVEFPFGTSEVFVTATAEDSEATVDVTGTTNLQTGANTITIVVTAPAGNKQTYTLTATVRTLSSDTTLAVLTVDENAISDGDTVYLDGTKNFVEVVAQATDLASTVEVTGATNLVIGTNQVKITVTAEDNSTRIYTVYVVYPDVTDTTLATFTIDGVTVTDGQTVELAYGVTDVEVVAVANTVNATVEIDGGSGLESGENTVTVTVIALDGETSQVYTVVLNVALSSDTSLAEFTVNGEAVEDAAVIEVPAYTESVEVVAVATDENAEVNISGADSLATGENTVTVTVIAPSGAETVYTLTVNVLTSSEVRITEILVGGVSAIDGDVIQTTDLEVTEIDVEVVTLDENATFEVTGNSELVLGDNLITIVVTAPNEDTAEYTVTFRIGGLPGNAKLESLSVGGTKLDLTAETLNVNLPAGTTTAPVIAATQELTAFVAVTGNKSLVTGANEIIVTVTATDGTTVRVYKVNVTVAAPSNNSGLAEMTLNGVKVVAGSDVTVASGTRLVEILATPSDRTSNVTYSGFQNLVAGLNVVTARITAENGTFTDYSINVIVPALSNDKTLKTFKIEGFSVLGKARITVAKGTTKLHVEAAANADGSSVTISGRDIQPGSNDLVVTVTAADGTSQSYTVKVKA